MSGKRNIVDEAEHSLKKRLKITDYFINNLKKDCLNSNKSCTGYSSKYYCVLYGNEWFFFVRNVVLSTENVVFRRVNSIIVHHRVILFHFLCKSLLKDG